MKADLPAHFTGDCAVGTVPDEPLAQFEIGDFKNFVYLILDWASHEAAIVDPQKDLTAPLDSLSANGFKLTHILLTHSHHDHIAGVPELAHLYPHLPIVVHQPDLHRLPARVREGSKIVHLKDGEVFHVGKTKIQALHTPGHSAGETSYFLGELAPPYLLTGDTVFIRDCGRTDLESGSTREMFESLQRIGKLPSETVILPGHHYARECASTLSRELRESPPFQCKSVAELEALP